MTQCTCTVYVHIEKLYMHVYMYMFATFKSDASGLTLGCLCLVFALEGVAGVGIIF